MQESLGAMDLADQVFAMGQTNMYAANFPSNHAQHKDVIHANVSQMSAHSII